ncbi:MAG: hypothetical protein ACR2Q4_09605, partial [Geminicoccaceae bacterium]
MVTSLGVALAMSSIVFCCPLQLCCFSSGITRRAGHKFSPLVLFCLIFEGYARSKAADHSLVKLVRIFERSLGEFGGSEGHEPGALKGLLYGLGLL